MMQQKLQINGDFLTYENISSLDIVKHLSNLSLVPGHMSSTMSSSKFPLQNKNRFNDVHAPPTTTPIPLVVLQFSKHRDFLTKCEKWSG